MGLAAPCAKYALGGPYASDAGQYTVKNEQSEVER